jgi:hypothetical protein
MYILHVLLVSIWTNTASFRPIWCLPHRHIGPVQIFPEDALRDRATFTINTSPVNVADITSVKHRPLAVQLRENRHNFKEGLLEKLFVLSSLYLLCTSFMKNTLIYFLHSDSTTWSCHRILVLFYTYLQKRCVHFPVRLLTLYCVCLECNSQCNRETVHEWDYRFPIAFILYFTRLLDMQIQSKSIYIYSMYRGAVSHIYGSRWTTSPNALHVA